jgi:hypothetical protein
VRKPETVVLVYRSAGRWCVPFACTWAIAWNTHLSPVFIPKLACVRLLNAVGHRQRESCLMLFIGDSPVKSQ